MVRILPLVGAAALFAQSAFAAAVPVRRTYNSNNNSNNYNQGSSSNQGNSYQQGSSYQQQQEAQQQSNSYGSNNNNYNVNQYNQNQYQSQESNQYQTQASNQYQTQASNNYNQYQSQESNNYNQNQYQQQQSNQYNNNYNQYTTTVATELAQETQAMDTTSTMMMEDTTSTMMMEDTTSTMMMETQAAVETSSSSYTMPSYGSGSSNNNNGYNNCVQQCMAQFGAPPSTMTQESLPPPTGTGAVHTILVAPDGAGLRYMPFAVNATVGDTIRYIWTTPNNHTATLSSSLAICNKSGIAEQRNFVSGVRNASAGNQVFDVTVETNDTQFFYCSVAEHCEKGMFGMINPGNNIGGQNTVGTMMASLMQSNPQLQAAYQYMRQNVTGTSAANWGMGIPLDGIPESQYEQVAANVLFTQATFALNNGMLETNQGAATPDGSPVQIASGLNVLLSDTSSTPVPSLSHSAVPSPTGSLTPVNAANNTSAAFSTRSVGTWATAVIAVAGWLLI